MDHHLQLPISKEVIKKLRVGDIVYLNGTTFTARDEAHHKMIEADTSTLPFDPSGMALYHCGPLIKKTNRGWQVVSAGPTTSNRMEFFEDKFIEKYGINIIIGKGGMGERTKKALQQYNAIYVAYTGGAGALAAEKVVKVSAVYWLEELGMPEAVWVFVVKDFGPLVVAMDAFGGSLYEKKKP